MGGHVEENKIYRKWRAIFASVIIGFVSVYASPAAAAFKLLMAKVVDSYGACSWYNNGDGTSTIKLVVNYRGITGNLGAQANGSLRPDYMFNSRGILVYTYDSSGKMRPSSAAARYVSMDGAKSAQAYNNGVDYVMYNGTYTSSNNIPEWAKKGKFTANVEIQINNSVIRDWPGIAIRAGNFTTGDDVGEITGAVYLSSMGSSSSCSVVDPTVPPPPPPPAITVSVAAPDWDLGELPRGESEKELKGVAQQLCFTYSGRDSSRRFVINASNENGTSMNRYLLKNVKKPTQSVPYTVTLDSGNNKFALPNINADPVTLDKGYKTCFVPTFKTSVDLTVDTGDYSDVLSFTVVTKS